MKNFFPLLGLLFCLLLSSCFSLTENIWVRANGSGTYEASLNFSQSFKTMQLNVSDFVSPESIAKFFKIEKLSPLDKLKSTPGVSKVNFSIPSTHVYKLSAEFTDIKGLNSILAMGSNEFSVQNQAFLDKKSFEREDPFEVLKDSITSRNQEIQSLREKYLDMAMIQMNIGFEQEIKKYDNPLFQTDDKHMLSAITKLNDWLENKSRLGISVKLKKYKKPKPSR